MARAEHLAIYSTGYAYVREIFRTKIMLPKVLKYDLGQRTFESALNILECIVLANKVREKNKYLSDLLLETDRQWTFLRLMYDLQGISEGKFKVLSERLTDVEKQCQGWLKWYGQQSGAKATDSTDVPKAIIRPRKTTTAPSAQS